MQRSTRHIKKVADGIDEANIGQVSQGWKSDLLVLLCEVTADCSLPTPRWCHGTEFRLPLTREDYTPCTTK